jgi:hypothetical protein
VQRAAIVHDGSSPSRGNQAFVLLVAPGPQRFSTDTIFIPILSLNRYSRPFSTGFIIDTHSFSLTCTGGSIMARY